MPVCTVVMSFKSCLHLHQGRADFFLLSTAYLGKHTHWQPASHPPPATHQCLANPACLIAEGANLLHIVGSVDARQLVCTRRAALNPCAPLRKPPFLLRALASAIRSVGRSRLRTCWSPPSTGVWDRAPGHRSPQ